MPRAASPRRSRTSQLSKLASKRSRPYAVRPDSEDSEDTWSEDSQSITSRSWQDLDISELDEAVDYEFKNGDRVWVRTQENNWRLGKVVKGQPKSMPLTRNANQYADYYQVHFGSNGRLNTRKYFAPLNGELKPDSDDIRVLLMAGGWISDDSGPE